MPKPTQEKRPAQSILVAKKVSLDATSTPAPTDSSVKSSVEKRSYTSIAASKPVQNSNQPWTQVSYGNRKPSGSHKTTAIEEQMGRRILFPRNQEGQKKSEADLMLALNEALQKAGEESHVRFCRTVRGNLCPFRQKSRCRVIDITKIEPLNLSNKVSGTASGRSRSS